MVFDCRPPLLPVSLDLRRVGLLSGLLPAVSAGVEVLPVSLDLRRVGLLSGLLPAVSAGVEVPSSEHGLSFGVGGGF